MPNVRRRRPLTEQATRTSDRLAHARPESARAGERAQIIWPAQAGARGVRDDGPPGAAALQRGRDGGTAGWGSGRAPTDGLAGDATRVDASLANRSTHRAQEVVRWALTHPRWEVVFQPTYAAYLNLIEPWWKGLRSLALKERRFDSWDEVTAAVAAATQYWNAHRHPVGWGRRKRRRAARRAGLAQLPLAA